MANTENDVVIDEKIKNINETPNQYNVIMLNDDHTPIDWVISILKEIFKHSSVSAESLTMKIHNEGSAIVGTYSYEIAEMKIIETINLSRSNGFPLVVKLGEN